jgi:hypothetical protein
MRQALLGVIGLGMVGCEQDIKEYVDCRCGAALSGVIIWLL